VTDHPSTADGADSTHDDQSRPIDDTTARRYVVSQVGLFLLTLAHALFTWPLADTLALFAGGIAVAFLVEAPSVRVGLFTHYLRPKVAGIPVSILIAWPAVVYLAVRVASLVVEGPIAVAGLAAVLGTLADALVEPGAVEDGAWRYSTMIPGPRVRGVPWWNAAGWLGVVFATALLPTLV
jgi:putative membrane protein